ncbi:MAG: hypothetical protein QF819_02630 [Gemmatimonadota bacterium]|jgi:hypothetical protein|nr:hypothetical protein [Gemmatimonadota bacterium]MDP6462192.1 hypothetical protein [Gemmatimonadota bacterium]MDP6530017.1 hypothetical protein [Gemmatimonadota bacterium]MDP6802057.1 hypothetical protein [Gemmatimonadota bacterium]MDP7031405.1 hypothetical protein [Gemmatimonadota bacterium]
MRICRALAPFCLAIVAAFLVSGPSGACKIEGVTIVGENACLHTAMDTPGKPASACASDCAQILKVASMATTDGVALDQFNGWKLHYAGTTAASDGLVVVEGSFCPTLRVVDATSSRAASKEESATAGTVLAAASDDCDMMGTVACAVAMKQGNCPTASAAASGKSCGMSGAATKKAPKKGGCCPSKKAAAKKSSCGASKGTH